MRKNDAQARGKLGKVFSLVLVVKNVSENTENEKRLARVLLFFSLETVFCGRSFLYTRSDAFADFF